jgi:hypothetical protein
LHKTGARIGLWIVTAEAADIGGVALGRETPTLEQ